MSDNFRENVDDKVSRNTRNSGDKSYLQQTKDTATGAYEDVARRAQPESEKSHTQRMTDKASGLTGNNDNSWTGTGNNDNSNSWTGATKDTLANLKNSASDALHSAKDYAKDTNSSNTGDTGSTTQDAKNAFNSGRNEAAAENRGY